MQLFRGLNHDPIIYKAILFLWRPVPLAACDSSPTLVPIDIFATPDKMLVGRQFSSAMQ